MSPDQPNMTQEETAALQQAMQAAQAQQAAQQHQGFSVEGIVKSLEERLVQEKFMSDQCAHNIAQLNKIIPALKAIP